MSVIDDLAEQIEAHVRRRLELLERSRTGRARQVAAIGRLQIKAYGVAVGRLPAIAWGLLEIAPRIDRNRRPGEIGAHAALLPGA